jgi:AcrR family transcriptional regulator
VTTVQYLPEKEDLLDAVAFFLAKQAAPAVDDPALAFRLKVAAHLVHGASRECRAEGTQDREVLTLLSRTLGIDPGEPHDPDERHARIRELSAQLAERARDPATDSESLAELRQVVLQILAGELKVVQPKFDLDMDIEKERA